jgi:hypothetical protein
MQVQDHNKYRLFEYHNDFTNPNFELGDILIRDKEEGNPIGVVIQLHPDGDCRTDMFGNCSTDDVRLATMDEIEKHRKELVAEIKL